MNLKMLIPGYNLYQAAHTGQLKYIIPGYSLFGKEGLFGGDPNNPPPNPPPYQPPPPPPPADTHGVAALGMSSDPSTSGMNVGQMDAVTPRQRIAQAILARKAAIPGAMPGLQ